MEQMKEILEISKRIFVVYQQLIQAKITKDTEAYHQNIGKIKKLRVEEQGLYSKIDRRKLSSIMGEMISSSRQCEFTPSREEKLIYNRIMENLYTESMSVIDSAKASSFALLGVSEKNFSACSNVLISVNNEIDILNICFLQDMINENNKHINNVITKKMEAFYICPLLEDEYIEACLEIESPILSSAFLASNSGLSKETYTEIEMLSCVGKLDLYTGDFYYRVKKAPENEESLIDYSIILCYIRASLQFMNKKEVEKWQKKCALQLSKITDNDKIIALFNKAFTSYDKDRSKFNMLSPIKYNEDNKKKTI